MWFELLQTYTGLTFNMDTSLIADCLMYIFKGLLVLLLLFFFKELKFVNSYTKVLKRKDEIEDE